MQIGAKDNMLLIFAEMIDFRLGMCLVTVMMWILWMDIWTVRLYNGIEAMLAIGRVMDAPDRTIRLQNTVMAFNDTFVDVTLFPLWFHIACVQIFDTVAECIAGMTLFWFGNWGKKYAYSKSKHFIACQRNQKKIDKWNGRSSEYTQSGAYMLASAAWSFPCGSSSSLDSWPITIADVITNELTNTAAI